MTKLIAIDEEAFQQLKDRLDRIEKKLDQKLEDKPQTTDRKLTKKEAAAYLGRSLNCLTTWMKQGLVPYQRIGRKVYFLESELREAGKKIK
jgi:tetrahydromethanopterin S-methyltransferase subunit G